MGFLYAGVPIRLHRGFSKIGNRLEQLMIDLTNTLMDVQAFHKMMRGRATATSPEEALLNYALVACQENLSDDVYLQTVYEMESDQPYPFQFTQEELLNELSTVRSAPQEIDKHYQADVLANELLRKLGTDYFYDLLGDQGYLFYDGQFHPFPRNALIALIQPKIKAKARWLGIKKLGSTLWNETLNSLNGQRCILLMGKPPQWYTAGPILDTPAWKDANNIFVTANGWLNPVAYATGEQPFFPGRDSRLFHKLSSPVEYNPDATNMPLWQSYLDILGFDQSEMRNLQEVFGVTLFPGYRGHDIGMFEGIGGSGKS